MQERKFTTRLALLVLAGLMGSACDPLSATTPGAPRGLHGTVVETEVPASSYALYDSLIPNLPGFSAPPIRKIRISVATQSPDYIEGAVSIFVMFNGQSYVFPVHLVLNNYLAYVGGLVAGYPKVFGTVCEDKTDWPDRLDFQLDGCDAARWSIDAVVDESLVPSFAYNMDTWDVTITPTNCADRHRLDLTPIAFSQFSPAVVEVRHDYDDVWSPLLPVGTYTGLVFDIQGGFNYPIETLRCF
jgi:hypothetical protein